MVVECIAELSFVKTSSNLQSISRPWLAESHDLLVGELVDSAINRHESQQFFISSLVIECSGEKPSSQEITGYLIRLT